MTQFEHEEAIGKTGNDPVAETFSVAGILITDRFFTCPVKHSDPEGPKLQVFVRQCAKSELTEKALESAKRILYFQGGPGFECSTTVPSNSGHVKVLLDRGYVVLLLDQRGTGMSTPLDAGTIAMQGDLNAQVEYCKQFRADSIVCDAELIREQLGIDKWTLLGQSFGGFCILTYLSMAPRNSLEAVIITGGMAPICHDHPDQVYQKLAKKLLRRNENYYEKFPQDVERVRTIVHHLDNNLVVTPNGGSLTSRRFRQIGLDLGMHGGNDRIHNLILKLSNDLLRFNHLTYKSRELLEHNLHYEGNPIYALLHESIYCQSEKASDWSSERVLATVPELCSDTTGQTPVYFYGENIFSWMFEDYAHLRPLKELAHRLSKESWTPLYDLKRLNTNQVPVAASCYIMDMYVEIDLAIESLRTIACSKDLVTNRWLHNGLRHAPEELLGYLFNLLQDGEQ